MSTSLHGRTVLDKFSDEFDSNLVQAVQDLVGSIDKIGLVVSNLPFLAEGFDQIVSLLQVVSGNHGEQVVINLVLKSTAEPVDEELRESVSTGNVTGGSYLELPEVGSLIGIVNSHTIVSQTEHDGQEETARACHEHEKTERVQGGESTESGNEGDNPCVVNKKGDLFEEGVLESLGFPLELGVLGSGSNSEGILERFVHPRETCEQQDWKVEVLLVTNHELDECRVLSVSLEFSERLSLLDGPGQDRHGIDIRITILSDGTGVVEVGDGVVTIVLVLPPLHRVTLHDTTPEESGVITVTTLAVDLVVQKIVSQPSALLEEKTHPQRTSHVDEDILREVQHGERGSPHSQVGGLFVDVEPDVALEHSHHPKVGSKLSVGLFESVLVSVLVLDTFYNKISFEELLQHIFGSLRVESGEDIGGIVTGMGEDNGTTGVLVPVGDVVNLVAVDDPSIVGGGVLLDLGPGVFWQFNLLLALEGDSCISSFTHVCFFFLFRRKFQTSELCEGLRNHVELAQRIPIMSFERRMPRHNVIKAYSVFSRASADGLVTKPP